MGFKEISLQAIDIKGHPDHPMTGYYVGKRQITTQLGDQWIYDFELENGQPVGIYGFTQLNMKMEHVQEGQLCRITYTGTQKMQTKYGMKDVHQCKVEIDDSAPVDGAVNQAAGNYEPQHQQAPQQNGFNASATQSANGNGRNGKPKPDLPF